MPDLLKDNYDEWYNKRKTHFIESKGESEKNKIEMKKWLKVFMGHAKNLVFSGSGYNGKGSPDHGKITSNKKRR